MSSSILRCIVPRVLKRSISLSSVNRATDTVDPADLAAFTTIFGKAFEEGHIKDTEAVYESMTKPAPPQNEFVNPEQLPLNATLLSTPPLVGNLEADLGCAERLAPLKKEYEEMRSLVKKLPAVDLSKGDKDQQDKALSEYTTEAYSVLLKFRENETAFFRVVDDVIHEKLHPFIGKREVLAQTAYGRVYIDTVTMPFPGVRYKEDTDEILALREKESSGLWKDLTIEEKKKLYRASFRKTLEENHEELQAPGDWKYLWGTTFLICWIAFTIDVLFDMFYAKKKDYFNYLRSPIVAEIVAEEMAQRGNGKYVDKYDLENMRWK